MVERSIRMSQSIVPFGVGAIYGFRGESLVGCDITMWGNVGTVIQAERLSDALGVSELRQPPAMVDRFGVAQGTLPYERFPRWLFCSKCRRMVQFWHGDEVEGRAPNCERCGVRHKLVPMRYILVCSDGHMGDFPWQWWAHSRPRGRDQEQCHSKNLEFRVDRRAGVGLAAMYVKCATCGARKDLSDITSDRVAAAVRCPGKQPWQKIDRAVQCDAARAVLNLGATNAYFARTVSALDIPPDSRHGGGASTLARLSVEPEFIVISTDPKGVLAERLVRRLARRLDVTEGEVWDAVAVHAAEVAGAAGAPRDAASAGPDALRDEEWDALRTPERERDPRDRFVSRAVRLFSGSPLLSNLDASVDRVVAIDRLRVVNALVSFRRYDLEGGDDVEVDLGAVCDWRPAVESFGEGIFIALDLDLIGQWERRAEPMNRAALLASRAEAAFLSGDTTVTPRLVLLHTLSHALLRRISFDSGYPTAALRERIYAKAPDQAGILIYAAESGEAGTLGGLVRLAESSRFAEILIRSIESLGWCSSDPVCGESAGQGYGGLNLAACHACCLVPETSCEHRNMFLDRAAVISRDGSGDGFFDSVWSEALAVGDER